MKIQQVEQYIEQLKKEADVQKTIKDTMSFSARDLTQLFEKFAEPDPIKKDSDSVSREINTANFDDETYLVVATLLSIRKDFVQFKKQFLNLDAVKEDDIKEWKDAAKGKDQAAMAAQEMLDDYYDKQKALIWVDSIIESIGSDAVIFASASKGKKGWLGNLIISSKRIGEVFSYGLKDVKKGIFG